MSVTHAAATRNSIADTVLTEIDSGAGNATIELRTSGDVEVATMTCSDPAGTVSGPTLTFSAITDDSSATGGVAAKFAIINPSAAECVYGTVGGPSSGEDIEMSTTTINATDKVSISSLTYTAPV